MSDEVPQNAPQNSGPEGTNRSDADSTEESTPQSGQSQSLSIFIPYFILGLSFGVYLIAQLSETTTRQRQLEQLIHQQEQAVQQAGQISSALGKFYGDLLETAKTDDNAKAIVNKYANVLHFNTETPENSSKATSNSSK
jgi:hypothetical protein